MLTLSAKFESWFSILFYLSETIYLFYALYLFEAHNICDGIWALMVMKR